MIAYVFQSYPENFAVQLFTICSNLPVKFANFRKSILFLTVSIVLFLYKLYGSGITNPSNFRLLYFLWIMILNYRLYQKTSLKNLFLKNNNKKQNKTKRVFNLQ